MKSSRRQGVDYHAQIAYGWKKEASVIGWSILWWQSNRSKGMDHEAWGSLLKENKCFIFACPDPCEVIKVWFCRTEIDSLRSKLPISFPYQFMKSWLSCTDSLPYNERSFGYTNIDLAMKIQLWLIILVWENEPKLKETTVNYFEFRHQQSIEECTRDNNELVTQDARIVQASLISSLEVARYDCLPHQFFP